MRGTLERDNLPHSESLGLPRQRRWMAGAYADWRQKPLATSMAAEPGTCQGIAVSGGDKTNDLDVFDQSSTICEAFIQNPNWRDWRPRGGNTTLQMRFENRKDGAG